MTSEYTPQQSSECTSDDVFSFLTYFRSLVNDYVDETTRNYFTTVINVAVWSPAEQERQTVVFGCQDDPGEEEKFNQVETMERLANELERMQLKPVFAAIAKQVPSEQAVYLVVLCTNGQHFVQKGRLSFCAKTGCMCAVDWGKVEATDCRFTGWLAELLRYHT